MRTTVLPPGGTAPDTEAGVQEPLVSPEGTGEVFKVPCLKSSSTGDVQTPGRSPSSEEEGEEEKGTVQCARVLPVGNHTELPTPMGVIPGGEGDVPATLSTPTTPSPLTAELLMAGTPLSTPLTVSTTTAAASSSFPLLGDAAVRSRGGSAKKPKKKLVFFGRASGRGGGGQHSSKAELLDSFRDEASSPALQGNKATAGPPEMILLQVKGTRGLDPHEATPCANGILVSPTLAARGSSGRSKGRRERSLWWSLVFLVQVVALLLAYIIIDKLLRSQINQQPAVCTTPACLRAASRLLDRMDRSVSPCDDFYQFTCGNYLKENVVPDDAYYRSAMQEMQEDILVIIRKMLDQDDMYENQTQAFGKAKRLYHSCMNTSFTVHEKDMADSPIFELLTKERLGQWPLIMLEEWPEEDYELERLLAQLNIYQVYTLIDSYITPDERNSSIYTLQVYKGSPALSRSYYLNTTSEEHIGYMAAYRALIEQTLKQLSPRAEVNTSHIDELIHFETRFAAISDADKCGDGGNSTSDYFVEDDEESGRMTVAQLEALVPEIKWTRMLTYTLDQYDLDLDVGSLIVTVHCTAYMPDLVQLLATTPKRVIVNYLVWRFVYRYMPYISNYFQQLWQQFHTEVPDPFEEHRYLSRWKECAEVVNEGFGAVLARMYVEQYYDQRISAKIDNIVEQVRLAFHEVISRQDWLDEEMKDVCADKLDMMGKKIGYPEYIKSGDLLDAEFDGLEILEDHLLNNILRMKRHEVRKELQKLSRPVDRKRDWMVQPLVVNAFHNPTANEIILPLGILREPFYHPAYPMYLNYGSLGVVVGHELVHGFDNHGKRYDKHGNVSQWWSDEMAERFTEKATCFIDQYGQYPIEMVGKNVDGNETLGDNICDNAGLLNAWLAYNRWRDIHGEEPMLPGLNYTLPQIFFITFGQIWCEVVSKEGYEKYSKDKHSPGIYRTNVVIQNSPFFSQVWGCPVGTPMNPERKCTLWK
ncbi:endothelin-converting enzyme 2-like [Oratosquilla oratoria]|uniref:endothelin-converting enzyme 2-like n=1 Tax=Oratosquilla oratoria TaxID=337810 RepID=UPI003F7620DD